MVINGTLVALIVTLIVVLYLMNKIQTSKNRNKLSKYFEYLNLFIVVYLVGLISQILFSKINLKLIYFDYISYIAIACIPVIFFAISQEYKGGKKIDIRYLYIVPIISLLVLWTSDWHNLFYAEYSTVISEVKYGYYFYIHMIYSYGLLAIAFVNIIIASVKKSGFLSAQTGLILLGELAPLLPNALGSLKIISISIYITPMMFAVTAVCFYIAIIRLKALNVIPVTLKVIVDNMSDAFVVISEDGTIADLNKTFVEKFKVFGEVKNKDNLFDILKSVDFISLSDIQKDIAEAVEKETTITKEYHIEKGTYDRYFEVDFQPVKSKDGTEYVATLILLRDVTQAKKDMEVMLKNESLVMLGELAGGVAHDINTPISAIKSGLLIFKSTAKSDDEKMLVERMDSCANKIVTLTNSLRNQIRNIGSNEVSDVNITSVIKDVSVIIHNELTKHRVNLNLDIKKDLIVKGNSAKLSQVVTNIIVNAVQAYEDKGGEVNVVVDEKNNNAVISIEDFAGGIPEHIRDNIGKNILTTKGVNGTGFGLYLAFSVITGAFGGEITFETEEGKGTTFYIRIPM
ncbi:MAG: PAS domain-containing protein [Clostridia bacterium]|nr:PAS domain-containing protein [Clostridia bacterium]